MKERTFSVGETVQKEDLNKPNISRQERQRIQKLEELLLERLQTDTTMEFCVSDVKSALIKRVGKHE